MIGKIKGILTEIEGNVGLIEITSGISYEVYLTPQLLTSAGLPQPIEIYTYHHIREDTQILFGFKEKKEYHIFKLLLSVSGVGPKTAYTVISYSNVENLIKAATTNDLEHFAQIPGLGKKTAMKLLLELSQKLNAEFKLEKMFLSDEDKTVVDALISLGFKNADAKKLLSQLPKDLPLEEKIKESIRLASKTP